MSYGSDGDHSVQGGARFDLASFCLDADQVGEVLEIEEQQVVPKVQEGQTLKKHVQFPLHVNRKTHEVYNRN